MELTSFFSIFFFFNDTATTEIYTLSLHDALPISRHRYVEQHEIGGFGLEPGEQRRGAVRLPRNHHPRVRLHDAARSEEHTSELQSQSNLVCRLLLEKKTKKISHQKTQSRTTCLTL